MEIIFELYETILYFFASPGWQRFALWGKIISGTISVVLIYGIVVLMMKTHFLKKKIERMKEIVAPAFKLPKSKITKQWEKIIRRLESANEADYKMALIEADKLFDDILVRIGYKGDTMADRLKQLDSSKFANIQQIWNSHKTRNSLVHDPFFHLAQTEAKKAVSAYEAALKDLEAIEE